MQDQAPESLRGHFLIAMPELSDPNFSQTVTLISEHNADGALGIVINRVFSYLSGKDIFDELKIEAHPGAESIPVHAGGPVHEDQLFIVHGPPFDWQGTLIVTPQLALSNSLDVLKALAVGSGPKSFLISLGCAGWGPGQLEDEIRQNAWLTSTADREIIFQLGVEHRWEAAVRRLGIDPALLSGTAGHA